MRRAAAISSAAHARAMRTAAPGMREYQVEAELLHEFYREGARAPAYGSIVAAGANACVLHYRENSAELRKGELLLIDAGCELDSYASDITRTFPVAGRFSAVQRDVYELVLASQEAGDQGREAGRRLHRLSRRRHARARPGPHRLQALQGQRGRGARRRVVQAVLHAPHRPLAGPGRARRRRLHAEGQVAQVEARHGAHRGAGPLHPPRAERAQGVLEHRRAHRGRRAGDGEGPRHPHRRMPEDE